MGQRLKLRLPAKRIPRSSALAPLLRRRIVGTARSFNAFVDRVGHRGVRGPGRRARRCRPSTAPRPITTSLTGTAPSLFRCMRGEGECAVVSTANPAYVPGAETPAPRTSSDTCSSGSTRAWHWRARSRRRRRSCSTCCCASSRPRGCSRSTRACYSTRPAPPWRQVEQRYGITVEVFDATRPGGTAWTAEHCCSERKVAALEQALERPRRLDHWACAASRPRREATRPSSSWDAAARGLEGQPPRRLDRGRCLGLHRTTRPALQRAARRGLRVHRLRPVHPSRRGPRGPLGRIGQDRVRTAPAGRARRRLMPPREVTP